MRIDDITTHGTPYGTNVNRGYSEWSGRVLSREYGLGILVQDGAGSHLKASTCLRAGTLLTPETFTEALKILSLVVHTDMNVRVKGDYEEQDIKCPVGCLVPSLLALGGPKSLAKLPDPDLHALPTAGAIGLLHDPGSAGIYLLLHSFGESGVMEASTWIALLSSIVRSNL